MTAVPPGRSNFRAWLRGQLSDRTRLIVGIIIDGIVIAIVLVINFGINKLHEGLDPKGFDEEIFGLLQIVFAAGSIVLALIYVVGDIAGALREKSGRRGRR